MLMAFPEKILMPVNNDKTFVFLDIDGVFNSAVYQAKVSKFEKENGMKIPVLHHSFDPIAVERFNKVMREVGDQCYLVISSSWRTDDNLSEYWKAVGFERMYDATTPYCPGTSRGDEIRMFIDKYDVSENNYLVIDDDLDMGDNCLFYHWYRVDPRFGLSETFAEELICRISMGYAEYDDMEDDIQSFFRNTYMHREYRTCRALAKKWLGIDLGEAEDEMPLEHF